MVSKTFIKFSYLNSMYYLILLNKSRFCIVEGFKLSSRQMRLFLGLLESNNGDRPQHFFYSDKLLFRISSLPPST